MSGLRRKQLLLVISLFIASCSTPGTGPDPDSITTPGDFVRSFEWNGRLRSYRLHVSPTALAAPASPLVLVFHGIPSNAAEIERISDFNRVANERGFIVAYPTAVEDWNTGCHDCPGSIAADLRVDDVGFVKDLIRRLNSEVGIDTGRVYAAGFSNGALFVHRLSCEASAEITAFASVAATMIEEIAVPPCQPARRAPMVAFHGSRGPSFPPEGRRFEDRPFGGEIVEVHLLSIDESVSIWSRRAACSPDPMMVDLPDTVADDTRVTRFDFAGCAGGADLVFYSIAGGGHTWPGAPVTFSPLLGTKSDDIIASESIADFFLTRTR